MPGASVQSTKSRLVFPTICLSLLLCLGLKTESLWTDEAFSAFVACHRSLSSLWHTLLIGDSSDLQMWLYYGYLHTWSVLFGTGEIAFRAANIPFILIYSLAIVWTRNNLFRSDWVWIAALSPFIWAYAGDARPYMTILALSTVAVLCLVASLTDPRYSNSRALPWCGLSAILIGLNLHMLMILLIPPSLIFALAYRLASRSLLKVGKWIRPAMLLSPLYLAYFVFLIWTFGRGTSYDYARPDLLSMGSVLFRFAGLSGFAPNRHYAVPFGPYIPGMLITSFGIVCALVLTVLPAVRARHARTISLAAAVLVGVLEALTLSFVFRQQIEVRHLACLFAFTLFMLFSGWDYAFTHSVRFPAAAVILVASIWLVSSFRINFLAEYRREDFRSAVAETIRLAALSNARIAVVADPAASAYYGLSITGPSPCFPLSAACAEALADVPWPHLASGEQATFWSAARIEDWLQEGRKQHQMRVLLISRSRHPMYANSPWWQVLRQTKDGNPVPFHGFYVYSSDAQRY